MALKKGNEIATIDVELVTITANVNGETIELALDTASQITVEPQISTQEPVQLIVKGVLKAQKRGKNTLTGNKITLKDNVFNPELVMLLQGGEIEYDTDGTTIKKYTPPVAGESLDELPVFSLNTYSGQYDASGLVVRHEKTTYPNCTGQPISMSSEDNVFRAQSYTIDSAPAVGEAPYTIEYVDKLPTVTAAS